MGKEGNTGGASLCLIRDIKYRGRLSSRPVICKAWGIPGWVAKLLAREPNPKLTVCNCEPVAIEADAAALSRIMTDIVPADCLVGVGLVCNTDTLTPQFSGGV